MVNPARTAVRSVKNLFNAARGIPAVILANLLLTRKCTQNSYQKVYTELPAVLYPTGTGKFSVYEYG